MSRQDLMSALEPVSVSERPFSADKRTHAPRTATQLILHLDLPYRQWDGPPLSWSEDFGKKRGQVYSRDGTEPQRSCNEVEVAKRLGRVRTHAVWISSYSPAQVPEIWRRWALGPREAPPWLRELDREIRRSIAHPSGGIPDVIAWNDDGSAASALFVECKGPTESFKESQEDWVSAAVACGVRLEQIAVAVRQFVATPASVSR